MPRGEGGRIYQVEENGAESCGLSTNSSFVLVHIPLRLVGEGEKIEATFLYRIGSFCGRDAPLLLQEGLPTSLRFRVPQELFRPRERLTVEVHAGGSANPQKLLWAKRWEVAWHGKTPALEPLAE